MADYTYVYVFLFYLIVSLCTEFVKLRLVKEYWVKTGSRHIEALSGFCSYVKKVLHPSDENL